MWLTLNKNRDNKEIRDLYEKLWDEIQNYDEVYAKNILNDFFEKLDEDQSKESMLNINKNRDNKEIKDLYDELWSKIQNHHEVYVKNILNDFLEKLDKNPPKEPPIFNTLNLWFKKPIFWIGLVSVALIVPIIFILFVWISLLIE